MYPDNDFYPSLPSPPALKPFNVLRQKWNQLRQGFPADRDFLGASLQADILLRSRTEIATYFRKHDCRKVFLEQLAPKNPENAKIPVEKEDEKWVTCDIVSSFMEQALKPEPIPSAVISKIYCSLVGSVRRAMSLDEFQLLFCKMHYRVTKETIMTDQKDVNEGPFQMVAKLNPGDIVRLIGDATRLADGMTRFEAETVPSINNSKTAEAGESSPTSGAESVAESSQDEPISGWVTLTGNKGTNFFSLHTPGYRVVKQTVLTNIFSMKNFRPVARLNVGDYVRAIGFPRREPQSGLLRVKATTVGLKKDSSGAMVVSTGYVTVEGNQNSVYLEQTENLVFPEEPEKPAASPAVGNGKRASEASGANGEPSAKKAKSNSPKNSPKNSPRARSKTPPRSPRSSKQEEA